MGDGEVGLPAVLLRGVEKAISMQQAPVAGYVARLRRSHPNATPAQIIAMLEKQYLATVTGAGAAVGGAAAAPAVGTAAAVALSGAETVFFFETTALFALAVAEVHGVRIAQVERRRTLLLAVVLGDNGAMLVEKMAGRTGEHWGDLLPEAIPLSSITAINKTLGRWFMRRYGRKQGLLALGRLAPLGIGAAIGAAGNHAFGRTVVTTSRRVFGPAPARFTDDGPVMIIEGTVG
ncbi:MAG TPA: hypothetical protein VN748_10410 [Pseudonocardiaceae bacterium]|jgi:hypothetical protein|nr:hypothetical protein [Pseudonocardiaceae bacterium]